MIETHCEYTRALEHFRAHLLANGHLVGDVGWQDLAEAVADIDVTRAALSLGRREGVSRAQTLLADKGPLCELASLAGWPRMSEARPTLAKVA